MILTEKTIYKPKDKEFNELGNLCFLSKNLYNSTLYAIRQHYFKNKSYLSYCEVNKQFTKENNIDYRMLPAKVSKQTQMLVDKAFKSFFTLRKKETNKAKIPKYLAKDGRQIVIYEKGAINHKNNIIKLSKTNIEIKTKIPYEEIKQIRIVPKNKFRIDIDVMYEAECKVNTNKTKYASVDLGVNNLIALFIDEDNPYLLNGKPLKSINQYYNKEISSLKSKLKKGVYTSNKITKLYNRRNNKVQDFMHKASRKLMNQLVLSKVTHLVVGYNKEIKQDISLGKKNNQNFVSIPFLILIHMIKYKAELLGIDVALQEESYTSKASALDLDRIPTFTEKINNFSGSRIKRGLYRTKNGLIINSDINGAINILRKHKPEYKPNFRWSIRKL